LVYGNGGPNVRQSIETVIGAVLVALDHRLAAWGR
jgi:hypothetical protein